MDDLLAWLQTSEGPLAYLVLGLASLVEYVFPPFPGDTVALFGVFLAATAGYHIALVYAALNLGALVGGMSAYGFGRWWRARRVARPPRFLRSQQARRALDAVLVRFEKHGAAYLALNRFVPALRSVFFVAAGLVGLPAWKVALYGTISAMAWNALLLALGWTVGAELERLQGIVSSYSYVAAGVVGVVALVALARWWWSRRRGSPEQAGEPSHEPGEEPRDAPSDVPSD